MNGYERIMKVLNGEKPDRVPMMLHNFMSASKEFGYTMKEFRSDPRVISKVFVDAAVKYGLDGILTDIDTAIEAHAMGALVDFPDDEPARVIGPAGKDFDEIYAKVTPESLIADERVQIYLEAIRLMRKQVGGEILIRGNADQGPYSLAMLIYGMENFLMDLMDEDRQEHIIKLIDKCYDVHLAFHKLIKEAGADITSFGDSSCGPDLISRDMYMTYANPYHRKLRNDLMDDKIKCICHICGNLDNILPDVADVRFAGIEVDYKTNVTRAHDILKGKSVMSGPIDPSGVFAFGDTSTVIRETENVLEIFKDGNIIIGAGCALPEITPEANIRAFVDTVKEKGKY